MTTSDWILVTNCVAILVAPVVALWIGGIIQRRSDTAKAKLTLFSTLIGLRYDPISRDGIRALNSIDAVFVDDPAVREAWTRYFTALNDPNLNLPAGFSLREDRRRELLLEMVKALNLRHKISSSDLLRTYIPMIVGEEQMIGMMERQIKRAQVEEELKRRGLPITPWPGLTTTTSTPPVENTSMALTPSGGKIFIGADGSPQV